MATKSPYEAQCLICGCLLAALLGAGRLAAQDLYGGHVTAVSGKWTSRLGTVYAHMTLPPRTQVDLDSKATTGYIRLLLPNGESQECRLGQGSNCRQLKVREAEPAGLWVGLSKALVELFSKDPEILETVQTTLTKGAGEPTIVVGVLPPELIGLQSRLFKLQPGLYRIKAVRPADDVSESTVWFLVACGRAQKDAIERQIALAKSALASESVPEELRFPLLAFYADDLARESTCSEVQGPRP